ncbi:MAG TPA: hypothetical protein DCZ40_11460 [Lachnospiraceae bacterium]|nr:hypothetical protein [Lachnospiraceae bacterium]
MKNGRITGIVLAVADVALAAACAVLYLGTDREKPHFEFQDVDTVYQEGMETSALLEGIAAFDNEDGDMTGSIVIEKIMENREEKSVVVFYAVSDKAGNAGKCSRKFPAVFEADEEDGIEVQDEWLMQSGFWTGLEGSREENISDNNREETVPENGQRGEEGNEQDASQIDESEEETENETAAGAPVLTLKATEINIEAGQAPAWVDVIGNLSDDKDSYETLFSNLHVSGYDVNQEGIYQATVMTEDSDGNQSRPVPLTIIVQ